MTETNKFRQYLYFGLHNLLAHKKSVAREKIRVSWPITLLHASSTVTISFNMQVKNVFSRIDSKH